MNRTASAFFLLSLLAFVCVPGSASAAWNGEPYSPGETLNPECAPTDENCTVVVPTDLVQADGNTTTVLPSVFGGVVTLGAPSPVSVPAPTGGAADFSPGDGTYEAHGWVGHVYRIYSYVDNGEDRLYSPGYADVRVFHNGETTESDEDYGIRLSWNSTDADISGYRILVGTDTGMSVHFFGSYDVSADTHELMDDGESYSDDMVVLPAAPVTLSLDQTLGSVGIGMDLESGYVLSVNGDTFTRGAEFISSPDGWGYGSLHVGPAGMFGQAAGWNPNDGGNGVWLEANAGEGGGFYADGDTAAIWSPGDNGLLKLYDEDLLPDGAPVFVFEDDGSIRSDTADITIEDNLLTQGAGVYGGDRSGGGSISQYGLLTLFNGAADAENLISNGTFDSSSDWDVSGGWSITGGHAEHTPGDYEDDELIQEGTLEGQQYYVSFNVGGSTGWVRACLDDGDCQTFDAGLGDVSFTGAWERERRIRISFQPLGGFDGTIDNVSVSSPYGDGLTFVRSDGNESLTLGLDEEEGSGDESHHGFLVQTTDTEGHTHAASIYLSEDNDARYEYVLPSLADAGGNDTFCMQGLANCSTDGRWTAVGASDVALADGLVGIGTEASGAKLSIDATGSTHRSFVEEDHFTGATSVRDVARNDDQGVVYAVDPVDNMLYVLAASDLNVIGSVSTWTSPNRVAYQDGYVYVGEANGIQAFDVSDPTDPTNIYATGMGEVVDLAVSGTHLYVALGDGGLVTMDISNPTSSQVGYLSGPFYGIVENGGNLYTMKGSDGLVIYELSGGIPTTEIGSYVAPGLYLSGHPEYAAGRVYAMNDETEHGLMVFDASDPTDPSPSGSAEIGEYRVNGEIARDGNRLFVADGQPDSVYAFDITDYDTPVLLDHFATDGNSFGLALTEDAVYLAAATGGVYKLSFDFLDNLAVKTQGGDVLIGGTDGDGFRYLNFGTTTGSGGFGVRNNNGVMEFKNETDEEWTPIGSGGDDSAWTHSGNDISFTDGLVGIGTEADTAALTVSGGDTSSDFVRTAHYGGADYRDVVPYPAGPLVFGLTEDGTSVDALISMDYPGPLENVDSYATEDTGVRLAADGYLIAIAEVSGLELVDSESGLAQQSFWSEEGSPSVTDVALGTDVAYVVGPTLGFATIDVSDPTDPSTMTVVDPGFPADNVVYDSNTDQAYVVGDNDVAVYDVSSPSSPSLLGAYHDADVSFTGHPAAQFDVFASLTNTSDADQSILLLDVSDPSAITVAGHANAGANRDDGAVSLFGPMMFVADGEEDSIYAYGIMDMSSPELFGHISEAGGTKAVSAFGFGGPPVIFGAGAGGVSIYEFADEGGEQLALQTEDGDVFISGTDTDGYRYLSFGDASGDSGFGFRDNNGVMEFKNEGDDAWTPIGTGDSSWIVDGSDISFSGGLVSIYGSLSVGDGALAYDADTGVTSIDNLSMGAMKFETDAGVVSWIDLPVENAETDTPESYTASIDQIPVLTIFGTATGGGTVSGTGVRLQNIGFQSGAADPLCIDGDGNVLIGSVDCADSSSERFKDKIADLREESGLAAIEKLRPVSFFYLPEFTGALDGNSNWNGEQLGFIAEEVQQVDPRLVTFNKDGVVSGVKYDKMAAVIVKAVQELASTTNAFAERFSSKEVDTDKLCVGATCVTEAEFLKMMQTAGANPAPPSDTPPPPADDATPPSDIAPAPDTPAEETPPVDIPPAPPADAPAL